MLISIIHTTPLIRIYYTQTKMSVRSGEGFTIIYYSHIRLEKIFAERYVQSTRLVSGLLAFVSNACIDILDE